MKIEINKIKPDPNQPRKTFDKERLQELAENYKKHEIIDPIEIDNNNMIILGERRWRASKLAGLKEVPVRRFNPKNDTERLERQIDEEMMKEPIPYHEKVEAFKKLAKMKGTDIKGLTKQASKFNPTVLYEADLYDKAPKEVKELAKNDKIGVRVIHHLGRSKLSKRKQIQIAKKAAKEGIGSNKVKEIIKNEEAKEEIKELFVNIKNEKKTPKDYVKIVEEGFINLSWWLDRKYFPTIAAILKQQELSDELLETMQTYVKLYILPALRDLGGDI